MEAPAPPLLRAPETDTNSPNDAGRTNALADPLREIQLPLPIAVGSNDVFDDAKTLTLCSDPDDALVVVFTT